MSERKKGGGLRLIRLRIHFPVDWLRLFDGSGTDMVTVRNGYFEGKENIEKIENKNSCFVIRTVFPSSPVVFKH